MSPPEQPQRSPVLESLGDELHVQIEASRELVRQSGMLFALAQCDAALAANDNDDGPLSR